MNLTEKVKQKALELGFDLVGITTAEPIEAEYVDLFEDWLNAGFAAQMVYMHKNIQKRFNPKLHLPTAQSVIVTAVNYKPKTQKAKTQKVLYGRVASYAQYEDYHTFIRDKLTILTDFIKTNVTESEPQFKICVDSDPIAEKILAQRAGLGFIGKNHLLINPYLGPQLLLGEIITTIKLDTDIPIKADCTSCTRCIEACPTAAIRPDGCFDANRCISYLTIEHKGNIPSDLAAKIGTHLFGCDDCLFACPYQHKAPAGKNKDFIHYPDRENLCLNEILNMTEEIFKKQFTNSPISRPGLKHLKSIARICLKNLS